MRALAQEAGKGLYGSDAAATARTLIMDGQELAELDGDQLLQQAMAKVNRHLSRNSELNRISLDFVGKVSDLSNQTLKCHVVPCHAIQRVWAPL